MARVRKIVCIPIAKLEDMANASPIYLQDHCVSPWVSSLKLALGSQCTWALREHRNADGASILLVEHHLEGNAMVATGSRECDIMRSTWKLQLADGKRQ